MPQNFWIYVDRAGKMPQLRHSAVDMKNYPHYVRYVGNRPVAYHGPVEVVATVSAIDGQLKFYDYSKNTFVPAESVCAE